MYPCMVAMAIDYNVRNLIFVVVATSIKVKFCQGTDRALNQARINDINCLVITELGVVAAAWN